MSPMPSDPDTARVHGSRMPLHDLAAQTARAIAYAAEARAGLRRLTTEAPVSLVSRYALLPFGQRGALAVLRIHLASNPEHSGFFSHFFLLPERYFDLGRLHGDIALQMALNEARRAMLGDDRWLSPAGRPLPNQFSAFWLVVSSAETGYLRLPYQVWDAVEGLIDELEKAK